jgi:hypothetical protein
MTTYSKAFAYFNTLPAGRGRFNLNITFGGEGEFDDCPWWFPACWVSPLGSEDCAEGSWVLVAG